MRIEDQKIRYVEPKETKREARFPEELPRKYTPEELFQAYDKSPKINKKAETVLSSYMDSPRERASGERVAQTLQETARFAEEVLEFLQVRTESITRCEGASAEDPSGMKEDYIPGYFSDIRLSTNRIKWALEAIRNIGERIDL